jgi:hypothetical protein
MSLTYRRLCVLLLRTGHTGKNFLLQNFGDKSFVIGSKASKDSIKFVRLKDLDLSDPTHRNKVYLTRATQKKAAIREAEKKFPVRVVE